MTFFDVVYYIK